MGHSSLQEANKSELVNTDERSPRGNELRVVIGTWSR